MKKINRLFSLLLLLAPICIMLSCQKADEKDKIENVVLDILDIDKTTAHDSGYYLIVMENSKNKFIIHELDLTGLKYDEAYTYRVKARKTTLYNIKNDISRKYTYEVLEVISKKLKTKDPVKDKP